MVLKPASEIVNTAEGESPGTWSAPKSGAAKDEARRDTRESRRHLAATAPSGAIVTTQNSSPQPAQVEPG